MENNSKLSSTGETWWKLCLKRIILAEVCRVETRVEGEVGRKEKEKQEDVLGKSNPGLDLGHTNDPERVD